MSGVDESISICVGTVRRPYCIQRFINSVRANFPDIAIVVGDQDPPNPHLHAFYEARRAQVVYVEEDAGVGAARNAAIAQIQTKYILFCDDDFVFSQETRLDGPLRILEHDASIDIVGGLVRDIVGGIDASTARVRRWEHFFTLDRKRRILMSTYIDAFTPKRREVDGVPYFLADTVLNWKLARRSAFDRGAGWDPQFKCNGEHSDFYLNIKENTDIGVAYCPSLIVYHHSPDDFSYMVKRDDQDGFRKLGEKWGIDEVLDIHEDQRRMILASGWIPRPRAETADPAWPRRDWVAPIDAGTPGPLDPTTWPASPCWVDASAVTLRVFFPGGAVRLTVQDGASFSVLVAVDNQSGRRIGCLGPRAPKLSYRALHGQESAPVSHERRETALTHDLMPGITFHFVNVVVDWDANTEETFELEIDLHTPEGGWLNQQATAMLTVDRTARPVVPSGEAAGMVIDFRAAALPDFLLLTEGLSFVEDWGRWSDANLADPVMFRFFDALPLKFRLELTCMAFGPNANRPIRIEIGECERTFTPIAASGTYRINVALDRPERTIRIRPPAPTSPGSLDERIQDDRLLGIGFVELKIVPVEVAHATRDGHRDDPAEASFWEAAYRQVDPWNYRTDYEQEKYRRTLELVPPGPIGRALEIGCAEGLFTEMLAPCVDQLVGLDISELALARAAKRCQKFTNVSFEIADFNHYLPAGRFDLIVCSEVLYYQKNQSTFQQLVGRITRSLAPNGHLLMAHANSVSDDRTTTGFDFSEVGAVFIGKQFARSANLAFLKELRTPLYRIQLFRHRAALAKADAESLPVRQYPREVIDLPATFIHTHIKWGGCALTFAESRYHYETDYVPILMYHRIASDSPPDLAPYTLDPARFEQQLQYLQRHGYSTAKTDDIWHFNCASNATMPGKFVALTFDDGYQDFADVAWPLLKRYGFTATVYLPIDHVGRHADWDRNYGAPAPLMDWATIRALAKDGVSFGSHGCSHRSLPSLAPADLARELRQSREVMNRELGAHPKGFCFPYTDFDPAVMDAVKGAAYEYAVAGIVPGNLAATPYALPRIEVRNDDDLDRFIAKLPPPRPSSQERQAEYRRMRAIRDRGTYFTLDDTG
ncbi:MAG TPA: polysaccharide deacetylase family protein [Rhodopila sp.]|uniref:DUF7024 domain-containing protein n=1 Tax=Rhodopila sp. TaxID=2480087 RepID=UPI002C619FE0|nr:polysaccharide deacetylase family protein [Rhodopila sp.]HVY15495.1 polysaccharide deacetylase family protein [Rhodopila sp.]